MISELVDNLGQSRQKGEKLRTTGWSCPNPLQVRELKRYRVAEGERNSGTHVSR